MLEGLAQGMRQLAVLELSTCGEAASPNAASAPPSTTTSPQLRQLAARGVRVEGRCLEAASWSMVQPMTPTLVGGGGLVVGHL